MRGADVRRVLQGGRRSRGGFVDIHWLAGTVGHARMGLVVPRFRQTAVARNRLRRRLKELWRCELQQHLPVLDVVIRTRPSAYTASFGALRSELVGWREALSA